MSQTSTLISCTGRITRAELANLPTPPATATHIPIPHSAVVETLAEALSHRHIGVVGAEFALMVKKVIRVRWKSMTGGNLRSFGLPLVRAFLQTLRTRRIPVPTKD